MTYVTLVLKQYSKSQLSTQLLPHALFSDRPSPPPAMVAGVPRFPGTLLIALSLFWFITTTIFKQPPTGETMKPQIKQEGHHHQVFKLARHTWLGEKVLPAPPLKFSFSLFVARRHHHRKIGHGHFVSWSKLDPRYGVQMHFVPTGPNPLHH
ncbi:hypothetical protein R6Q59_010440 [Mikania micrantha]